MSALHSRGIRPATLVGCLFLLALVVTGCSSGKRSFQFDGNIFLADLNPTSAGVLGALYVTLIISVVAQALGVLLGVLAALGKMAKIVPLRVIANGYIWFFRGTPLLVQLVFFYYGFGAAHIWGWDDITLMGGFFIPGAVWAAMVILGVNEGAYMAEIIRAGILAVDPGQTEAAKSLGMTYRLTMTRIVLPQAARVIIPPLGNEFNNMLKTTSLIFVLGVVETYNHYVILQGLNYRPFEAYAACALWFLLLTTIWGFIQSRIEIRFSRGTATGSAGQSGPGNPGFAARLMSLRAPIEQ